MRNVSSTCSGSSCAPNYSEQKARQQTPTPYIDGGVLNREEEKQQHHCADLLRAAGVSARRADVLASEHSESRIREVIDAMHEYVARGGVIYSPGGWVAVGLSEYTIAPKLERPRPKQLTPEERRAAAIDHNRQQRAKLEGPAYVGSQVLR